MKWVGGPADEFSDPIPDPGMPMSHDAPPSLSAEPSRVETVVVVSDQPEVGRSVQNAVLGALPGADVSIVPVLDGPLGAEMQGGTLCIVCCDRPDALAEAVARITLLKPQRPVIAITARSAAQSSVDWVETLLRAGATDVVLGGENDLDQLSISIPKLLFQQDDAAAKDFAARNTALQCALEGIQAENRTLRSLIERFEALAGTDQLTGLPNRRAFEQRLDELFSGSRRYGAELTCLMIDVDRLKVVNDTLGHAAGDELLRIVGQVIAKECRRSDFAARLGGDEFVALLPHTPAAAGRMLASRIQQNLKIQVRPLAARLGALGRGLGVSIGISSSATPAVRTQADLLIRADDALYEGKNTQRGSVCLSLGSQDARKVG